MAEITEKKTVSEAPEKTEVPESTVQTETGKGKKEKPEKNKKQKKRKKRSVGKTILTIMIILVLIFIAAMKIPFTRSYIGKAFPMLAQKKSTAGNSIYQIYTVEKHDITTSLTGTGTLQPIDQYYITARVSGDILSADFEEMDKVEEGQLLYVIDSSDVEDDISDLRKDLSDALEDLSDAKADYADLNVYSEYSGTIREIYAEDGDTVQKSARLCYIVDSDTMLLEIPFFASDTDHIGKNAAASVTFSTGSEVLSGHVTEISGLTEVNANNSLTRKVTIAVKNPGGITFGMNAYASVIGKNGEEIACCAEGTFKYNVEETLTSSASGDIEKIYFEEGDKIAEGQLFAVLSSESLDNQVKNLQKQVDNLEKQLDKKEESLEDYNITADISGTIAQKNYKALDTIGQSSMSSTTTLAIIYDMSKLTFDLAIDELDLSKIAVGQKVKITTDSFAGMEFEGEITKKSIIGSSMSGTTTYPVTVELDGNDYLLPGMNINAEIIISGVENAVSIPLSALSRGGTVEKVKDISSIDLSQRTVTEKPETETVTVETGESNSDYIEITSGLSEGDIIIVEMRNASTDLFSMMAGMGGMHTGMSENAGYGGYGGGNFGGGMSQRQEGNFGGAGQRGGMPGGMR